jgi:hypothetical protein
LKDGLAKMSLWAKNAGTRKSSKFENIEILDKLPSFWLEE